MLKFKKPIIISNTSETSCCGEFIEPNIIKIYLPRCHDTERDVMNVIYHEYTHYIIYSSKILTLIFNKLNKYAIDRCLNMGMTSPREVYKHIPEENFCILVSNILSKIIKTKEINYKMELTLDNVYNSQTMWPWNYEQCRYYAKKQGYKYIVFNGLVYNTDDVAMENIICDETVLKK